MTDVIDNTTLIKLRFSILLQELNKKKPYRHIMATSEEIRRYGTILRKRKLRFE